MEQKFQSSRRCNSAKTAHDCIRMSVEVPVQTAFNFFGEKNLYGDAWLINGPIYATSDQDNVVI